MNWNNLLSIHIYIYIYIYDHSDYCCYQTVYQTQLVELLLLWANGFEHTGLEMIRRIAVNDTIRYDVTSINSIYTMENQRLSCFNNKILLVGVGYTRRGNTTKTVVQPDRFVRRASQARMLITEQSSHWNKWLIWNTWTMLCKPLAKWTLCNYIWLTALTHGGCNRIERNFIR